MTRLLSGGGESGAGAAVLGSQRAASRRCSPAPARRQAGKAPSTSCWRKVISGELDVDKMDYLLRDGLFCGVRYGNYDLERLIDTMLPLADPERGEWGIGVEEGGVHALEALVMARYYMFTQVYFNVTGKALELHFNAWLEETGQRWPADPRGFLAEDDISIWATMRRSANPHAAAVVERQHFPVAFETREHLSPAEKNRFEALLPGLAERFGAANPLPLPLRQRLAPHGQEPPPRLGAPLRRHSRAHGAGQPVHPPPGAHRSLPHLHHPAAARRGGASAAPELGLTATAASRALCSPIHGLISRGRSCSAPRRGWDGAGTESSRPRGGAARRSARAGRAAGRRPCRPAPGGGRRPAPRKSWGGAAGARRARLQSRLRTGCGALRLKGPRAAESASRKRMASISSSQWIQGSHWRPLAERPPAPRRKGSSILGQGAAVRVQHDAGAQEDTPHAEALNASAVAASQATVTAARKSSPAG